MDELRRRDLLASVGSVGMAGAFAGCLDGSLGGTGDEPSGTHEHVREGSVVDYPGLVDGAATVAADEQAIQYDEPETTFTLEASVARTSSETTLRATRDLSGETMAGFVAPVYDGAAERFAYHVFANEAFVEHADWHAIVVPTGGEPTAYDWDGFEHLQGDVYGATVESEDSVRAALLADAPASDLAMNGGADATGLSLTRGENVRSSAPAVRFDFDYDAESERLVVMHTSGEHVQSERIRFHSQSDFEVLSEFEGTVTAGDSATLSVSSDATVGLVWEAEDGSETATLARWDAPDS